MPTDLKARRRRAAGVVRVYLACQVLSFLALLSAAFVLLQGGGKWTVLGIRIRLDDPTNPILIFAACRAVLAWVVGTAPGESWIRKAGRSAQAAGWAALGVLIVTLCIDRSTAKRSSTPWRQDILVVAVAGLALARGIEWRVGPLQGPGLSRRDPWAPSGHPRVFTLPRGAPAGDSAGGVASKRALVRLSDSASVLDDGTHKRRVLGGVLHVFHVDLATLLFVGFAGWALVSALASPFRPDTLGAWSSNWLPGLGMFWCVRLAWREDRHAGTFSALLLLALGLTIFTGGLQLLTGHSPMDLAPGLPSSLGERLSSARATGLSLHPNFLAQLLAGLVLFGLALAAASPRAAKAVWLYGLAAVGLGLLVMTRSRGGLIAVVCGAVFVALASRRRWALPLLLVAGIGLLSLVGAHRERFLGLVRVVTRGEAPAHLVGWRPILWKAGLDLAGKKPLVGWGPGQEVFEAVFRQTWPETAREIEAYHAHNLYLEMAVETGFTGLGLFGMLALGAGWKAWRTRTGRGPQGRILTLGAAAALVALLLHGLVDTPLNRGTWLLFGVTLGILAGGCHTYQQGKDSGSDPAGSTPHPTPEGCNSPHDETEAS